MAFEPPNCARGAKPSFTARPRPSSQRTETHPLNRVNGSASQKQAQWLSRATEAERAGDAVQAEHWFRVLRGQE